MSKRRHSTRGVTFVEMVTVMTVIAILSVLAAPSFTRTVEHARADIAASNLQAIWNAQRIFWLENGEYAHQLRDLVELGLVDPSLLKTKASYRYRVHGAGQDAFVAEANRMHSKRWKGVLEIDETGTITGLIQAKGDYQIIPARY